MSDVSDADRRAYNLLHLAESFAPAALAPRLRRVKDRVRERIVARLAAKPAGRALAIDRARGVSPEEFRERWMKPGLPVILEGAAAGWESARRWTVDYFESRYGSDHALLVEAEGLTGHGTKGRYELLDVKDVMKDIKRKGGRYLRFSPLLDNHPELKSELDVAWLNRYRNPWSPADGYQLFVGPAGSRTTIHCAMQCNFFVMVRGEKRWRLVPSRYNAIVNPPADRALYNHSALDVYAPDLSLWPGFDKVDSYDFVLKPGDVLYNPPFMWHDVANVTDTIGVGYRFGYFAGALKASTTHTLMRLTANNPPLWKSLWYTMKDINLIYASTNGNFKEVYAKLNERLERHAAQNGR